MDSKIGLSNHIPLSALWFIIPAGISTILLIVVFWKKKNLKLWELYLCLNAASLFLENGIFIFLNSYEYKPRILNNPYSDSALGAYFSQSYYVTSVALMIAAYQLRFRWTLLFSAMFVGIEYLFLSLGIYKLNWWRPGYTAVGLVIYFWMSKKWYRFLLQPSSRFMRWSSLFCMNYGNYAVIMAIPTILERFQLVGGWFDNPVRDTIAVIIIILLVRSAVIATLCFCRAHWAILAFTPAVFLAGYLVLIKLNIFVYQYLWVVGLFSASDIAVLLFCYYFHRRLVKSAC